MGLVFPQALPFFVLLGIVISAAMVAQCWSQVQAWPPYKTVRGSKQDESLRI